MSLNHPTLPRHLLQNFIWREQISEVLENLDNDTIVVLYGMGGTGKTCLAVQTAYFIADPSQVDEPLRGLRSLDVPNKDDIKKIIANLHGKFNQVAYVDMASCAVNEENEFTFWSTLSKGVIASKNDSVPGSVRDRLLDYLPEPGHKTLFVLDSGEQIKTEFLAKSLSDLALSASVLVTCRYPIENIQGGKSISINPMRQLEGSPLNVRYSETVRLFARRVGLELYSRANEQQEERKKELDKFVNALLYDTEEDSVRTIARICELCECIPSAIVKAASYFAELAKVRLPKQNSSSHNSSDEMMTKHIDAVKNILKDASNKLSKGQEIPMGVFELHGKTCGRFGTLRDSIQWSYDRLGFSGNKDTQQSLFRALSIFPDEWTLNDAQFVCEEIDAEAVKEAHQALQDTQLVVANKDRFTFSQPIRELAKELYKQLCTDSERERVQNKLTLIHLMKYLKSSDEASRVNLETNKRDIDAAMVFAFSNMPKSFKTVADVIEETLRVDKIYSRACLPLAHTLLSILEGNGISEPEAASETESGFELKNDKTTCVLPANLFHLHRGRMISKVVSNTEPLTALFGKSDPDYTTLHAIEDPDVWLHETEATILVLTEDFKLKTDAEKQMSHRLLACIYFITHDWWDAYLQEKNPTARQVLTQWKNHAKDDIGNVYDLLEQFDTHYQQKSERKGREQKKTEWRQVRKALKGLQVELKLHSPYFYDASPSETQAQTDPSGVQTIPKSVHDHALQPSRFLIGIMERYSGEAGFYLRHERAGTDGSGNPQMLPGWEEHYATSSDALRQDTDSLFRFYRQWTHNDQAQRYMEAKDSKVFAACYEALTDEHREFKEYIARDGGIDLSLLDLEMLAEVYGALGGGHANNNNLTLASLCYSGAILLALAVMLIERDTYGIRFYQEHHEVRIDKQAWFAPNLLMQVIQMPKLFRGGYAEGRQAREKALVVWTYFWQSEASSQPTLALSIKSVDNLLPKPPKSEKELLTEPNLRVVAETIRQVAARISAPSQEDWWPKDKQELTLLQEIATYFSESALESLLTEALSEIE